MIPGLPWAVALFGLFASVQQAQAAVPEGQWQTAFRDGVVEISRCDTTLCGFVIAADPTRSAAENVDSRNPDPMLRQRPLIGLPVLWGFQMASDGWARGRLYNPETGQTFRAALRLISADRLKVTACLGPFCLSRIWTRVQPAASTWSAR